MDGNKKTRCLWFIKNGKVFFNNSLAFWKKLVKR